MSMESVVAPTAEGSLAKTPFVHLLVYVADRMLSGSMVLAETSRAPGEENTIYFFQGSASKIRIAEPVAHLGRVLFELGYLNEADLNSSLMALADGTELHGEHLVRQGKIDRSQLMRALAAQLNRKMAYLYTLPSDTAFAFYDGANLLEQWGGPEITPLDPLPTIWSAVRSRADEPIVDHTLARLGNTALKLHDQADAPRFGFTPPEMAIVDLIRARPCSLPMLLASGLLPERTIKLIVYGLLITRHLDHRADSAPPIGVERLTDTAKLRMAQAMSGVPLARLKLTSRRAEGGTEVPSEPRPSSPSTNITTSMPAPRSSGAPAPATSSPPSLTPEHVAFRDEVVRRAEAIDREDYFTMLGVPRTSQFPEIQAAYYALAKIWHPDRLPAEIASVRDSASKVFARMSEAFETLSDGVRRKRYVDVLKGGGGTPEEADQIQQIIDVATDFQRAEILWRRHDPSAEKLIERVYRADPEQSDYIALWVALQMTKRAADAPVDDLIKLCDHAIEMSERCERAYFCRANLKKRIGKVDSSMSDFRAAYELNPKNLDAAREVRLYEMRRSKHPDRKSTPSPRRSTTPPAGGKSNPPGRSISPSKKSSNPPKKEGGMLSGLGKLFKR
jgi:curved DNA-binding protein CbpA